MVSWSRRIMNLISIIPATVAEHEWCAALMSRSEPWTILGRSIDQSRAICQNPEYLLFIAHSDAEPIGFILIHPRGVAGSPYISSIVVVEEVRRRGIGTELLRFAEKLFRGEANHIFLTVSSFNGRARALYERLGYAAVGELKDYIIKGASEILMHKRLRD
jgi:ribosomal protein S18 acetylase RimI-like enzyme